MTRHWGVLLGFGPQLIQIIRRSLKGETFLAEEEALKVVRSLPHGDAAAVYAEAIQQRMLNLSFILSDQSYRMAPMAKYMWPTGCSLRAAEP